MLAVGFLETSATGYHLENVYWTSLIWAGKTCVWI